MMINKYFMEIDEHGWEFIDLENCPRCNKNPGVTQIHDDRMFGNGCFEACVRCPRCDVTPEATQIRSIKYRVDNNTVGFNEHDAIYLAIKNWNFRALKNRERTK